MPISTSLDPSPLKGVGLPFSLDNSVEKAKLALQNRLTIPKFDTVDMSKAINWDVTFDIAGNTQRLWFHSLPFIGDLLFAYKETENEAFLAHAAFLLTDYLRWLDVQKPNHPGWSDEHMVANRSTLLVFILFESDEGKITLPEELITLLQDSLIKHAIWLIDDIHYVENNHGTMMDRAVLLIGLSSIGKSSGLGSNWIRRAVSRIEMMARKTFDKDGCCVENSPSYHFFNVGLFTAISDQLREHQLDSLAPDLNDIIAKAQTISPFFTRTDGTVSLIGDSELVSTLADKAAASSVFGTRFFPDSGFFISKGKDLYVTAKCGGSSFVHRHIDDTSITVNYKGQDIIVDAGYYDYDTANSKFTRWFRSHLAHSGIFTTDSDKVRFKNYPTPQSLADMGHFYSDDDLSTLVMNSYHVSDVKVTRYLAVVGSDAIIVSDNIQSDRVVTWRQQFLLHPDCQVTLNGDSAHVVLDNSEWDITLTTMSNHSVRIATGSYSEGFRIRRETKCLLFSGTSNTAALHTSIVKRTERPS